MLKGWEVAEIPQPEASSLGIAWYKAKFNQTLAEIEDHFSKYRISDALMATYKLIWDDYSSWLLEIIKPAYQQPIDKKTFDEVIGIFENNLKLLHPFMPFLTEEVWQHIAERSPQEALVISQWPKVEKVDEKLIGQFEFAAAKLACGQHEGPNFVIGHPALTADRRSVFLCLRIGAATPAARIGRGHLAPVAGSVLA